MTDWPPQRLLPPNPDDYTPAQQAAHDAYINSPRGRVVGPIALWIHHPELAMGTHKLGGYLRFESTLGPRLTELAICTTAKLWQAEFEWYAHKPLAIKAGVSEEVLEAIRTGTPPPFDTEEEAAVHAFAQEAAEKRRTSQALYDATVKVIGEDRLLDLVSLMGFYAMVSLTLNTFNVLPPADAEPQFS